MPSELQPEQTVLTVSDYTATYPDPITVRAGDPLIIGRADTEWPAYVWCTGPDGRDGWMPARFFRQETADHGVALRDYSAKELSIKAGELVILVEEAGGWWWATNAAGVSGWLPIATLVSDTR